MASPFTCIILPNTFSPILKGSFTEIEQIKRGHQYEQLETGWANHHYRDYHYRGGIFTGAASFQYRQHAS
jgi:hypothetical protein